jgi:hypothetical protein
MKLTLQLAPALSTLQVRLAAVEDVAAEADVAVDEDEVGEAARVLQIFHQRHLKHRLKSMHI